MSSLDTLLRPTTVALVGASESNFYATNLFRRTTQNSAIRLYPVNPKHRKVFGLDCVPSLTDLPEVVDLAVLIVPNRVVLPVLAECNALGVRSAIVVAGGFAESSLSTDREMQSEVSRSLRSGGTRVLGPSCLGIVNVVDSIDVFAGHIGPPLVPGGLAVVSQSGANCHSFIYGAARRRIGLSYLVSTGNEVDLTAADVMREVVSDSRTKAVALFLEEIRNLDLFESLAATCLEKGIPIVAVKVGRTQASAAAAAAHTGASPGSDVVIDALFKKYGIHRTATVEEALDSVLLSSTGWRPSPERASDVYVLSVAGGSASAIADLMHAHGVDLPPLSRKARTKLEALLPPRVSVQNPLDLSTQVRRDVEGAWQKVLTILAEESAGGVVVDVEATDLSDEAWGSQKALARRTGTAALRTTMADGIPLRHDNTGSTVALPPIGRGLQSACSAVSALLDFVDARERHARRSPRVSDESMPPALDALVSGLAHRTAGLLPEDDSLALLESAGIPVARYVVASDVESLVDGVRSTDLEVGVLKGVISGVAHKTELGLVLSDVTKETLSEVGEVLVQRMRTLPGRDEAQRHALLFQEKIDAAYEVVLSTSRIEGGRILLTAGWGGVAVDLLKTTASRLAPVELADAWSMLQETRLLEYLGGWRGSLAGDIQALVETAIRLTIVAGWLAPWVSEIEINPVLIRGQGHGVVAVDALVHWSPKAVA